MYLYRKIKRPCWEIDNSGSSVTEAPADAVQDLNTTFGGAKNTLSFWSGGEDLGSENEIGLAAVCGIENVKGGKGIPEAVDIVWVLGRLFSENDIQVRDVPNPHPIQRLQALHRDVVELTASKLGVVANLIYAAVNSSNQCKRLTKEEFLDVFRGAIKKQWVKKESLPQEIQKAI